MYHTNRRRFLKSTAGATFAPNILLGKGSSRTLNVASVGCNGKGTSDISEISKGNRIVALCDVDLKRAEGAFNKFPEAKQFSDYREMFATMADKIDVVTVTTPDHMHFAIAVEALRHGKPLMVQKPLCNRIWEARALAKLAKEKGVFTVMGNQGATTQDTRLLREWIEAGLIGEVKEVYYWTNRPIWPQGPGLTFPAEPVPDTLNWDVWQGTCATERPYNSGIHPFKWRGFWDYGCGALGDIGCHCFNSAFWALDLKGDFIVEASKVSGFDDTIAPLSSSLVYHFPAKGKRGPVKVFWRDGKKNPNNGSDYVRPPGIPADLKLSEEFGQVFVGTEGTIYVPDAYCSGAPASIRKNSAKRPAKCRRNMIACSAAPPRNCAARSVAKARCRFPTLSTTPGRSPRWCWPAIWPCARARRSTGILPKPKSAACPNLRRCSRESTARAGSRSSPDPPAVDSGDLPHPALQSVVSPLRRLLGYIAAWPMPVTSINPDLTAGQRSRRNKRPPKTQEGGSSS